MEFTIVPKVGLGRFRLSSRLSEIITELQNQSEIFSEVDCVIEESNIAPIYLYLKTQGNLLSYPRT